MTVAKDLHLLSDICRQNAESVSRDIADRENDPRSMCLWNIHNRMMISQEIMNMYERTWGSDDFPDVDDDTVGELMERVMVVTKDLFVDVVSAIEKAVKDCVSIYKTSGLKEDALRKTSHLYLRNIMDSAVRRGLIDDRTFDEWDDILVIRNLVAHNNSVSDRNKRYSVGGIAISMRAGRMMKGPLNTFIVLTGRIIELFYDWLILMHREFGPT
ncbi:MAG: hypothetical protein IJL79_04260 [Candidatus Methanomethylophilaceae archaeon]|nr:hypothetical protein [Candidatus Methanomethylophilaceae archaeon]